MIDRSHGAVNDWIDDPWFCWDVTEVGFVCKVHVNDDGWLSCGVSLGALRKFSSKQHYCFMDGGLSPSWDGTLTSARRPFVDPASSGWSCWKLYMEIPKELGVLGEGVGADWSYYYPYTRKRISEREYQKCAIIFDRFFLQTFLQDSIMMCKSLDERKMRTADSVTISLRAKRLTWVSQLMATTLVRGGPRIMTIKLMCNDGWQSDWRHRGLYDALSRVSISW